MRFRESKKQGDEKREASRRIAKNQASELKVEPVRRQGERKYVL
jgi:hypothetical protein